MLKKALSYYLSLSLLVASVPVSLVSHTCHLFGITETTLFVADACCALEKETSTTTIDVNCCSLEVNVLSADLSSTLSDATALIAIQVPLAMVIPVVWRSAINPKAILAFSDSSPPLSSLDILRLIQVFRI